MNQASTAVAAAGELDAAGRHEDAISELARASRQGDYTAMSVLAHRLLVGDRAPALPAQALRLLQDAASHGEGSAMARLAALAAGGAHVEQDWNLAMRLLGNAAEAGDEGACGQLRVLAPGATGDWRSVAASVRLDQWLRPPARDVLHPRVVRTPGLLAPAGCDWLMSRARGRLERARVYDPLHRKESVEQVRSNSAANFNLATIDVVQFVLQARMSLACGMPMVMFEPPNVLHYETGQQFAEHCDFVDPATPGYERLLREQGQRMVTFLLYLNDDYDGGETTFPELGIRHRGTRGDGLFFINAHENGLPDHRMIHAGSPPTRGTKWVVSQFIRNIRLRP